MEIGDLSSANCSGICVKYHGKYIKVTVGKW